MVEVTLDLSSLEQGTISETGTKSDANDQIRTYYYITNDSSFFKGVADIRATVLKPVEGSMEGEPRSSPTTYDRIPGVPSNYTVNASEFNNPNYIILYYWWDSGNEIDHTYKRGCVTLRIPVYNNAGNKPHAIGYRDVSSSTYASFDIAYDSIDVFGNSITYTRNGEIVTDSITQLLNASSVNYSAVFRGERDSEDKPCDIALLGYDSDDHVRYSKRWIPTLDDLVIDFSDGLPIAKWKFVLKVDGVSTLKPSHILNDHKKITLQMDSWEMTQDDILVNSGMCEEISGDILTYPFPKSFWELDDNDKLEMFMLPEPYEEKHSIVHDNPDGTEYFNQHSNAYDSALSNLNNNYRIRLEILTDEETVIGEITKDLSLTAAGQITINYEQITRRSCSLSLINVDNKYIPTKNSPFWLNRKFKLWLGLVVGKDTYWWSQGIFYTVSANATGRILSIEGVDKGGALDGTLKLNMTEAQYQFKRGKALTEMIKQTLAIDVGNPYGSKNSPIGFGGNRPIDSQPPLIGIEYYGFNTVADISIDANSYISEMFVNMAELYAADCYYNTNGNLVFEQHIDSSGYNYVRTQWNFTDLSSTFEDVNYEYSYEGENVVTVYTNTTEAGVRNVAWTAYNTNPLSPLNVATGIRRAPHIEIPYYNHIDEVALAQAQADLKEIETEMKTKGIDAAVTVYGNIDCNNRQVIYWDEANLERFEEAYESWDYTAEELAGSISTVMGTSSEYDGVEIAYSPILQTDDGAVLLNADTVDTYISSLISTLPEGWTTEALIAADVTGLTVGTTAINKLIADAGATAIKTGESMHYVGKYGALQLAKDEIYAIQNANEAQQIKDCRSTANHYLLANSMLGMTLNFNAPIIPHMDVNKTIDITDRYANIEDGIYVVQSVTIPLTSNKMQISATNINWLPNDMTFGGVSEIVQSNSNQNGGAGT